jgi:hypothetical protein
MVLQTDNPVGILIADMHQPGIDDPAGSSPSASEIFRQNGSLHCQRHGGRQKQRQKNTDTKSCHSNLGCLVRGEKYLLSVDSTL